MKRRLLFSDRVILEETFHADLLMWCQLAELQPDLPHPECTEAVFVFDSKIIYFLKRQIIQVYTPLTDNYLQLGRFIRLLSGVNVPERETDPAYVLDLAQLAVMIDKGRKNPFDCSVSWLLPPLDRHLGQIH